MDTKLHNKLDFKLLFESAPGLYLVLNPDLTILTASENYIQATMIKRDEVVGKHLFEVFPDNPDDPTSNGVAQLRASLNRVLTTKLPDSMAVQKYDIRNRHGEFEERHWSPFNFPVFNSQNEIEYIIHRAEDVTEIVKLKLERFNLSRISEELKAENEHLEKIRQAQKMEAMGQLAGGVAHDFNNILATIIILCEDLMKNPKSPEFVKDHVSQILKGSDKARLLTRKLLAFSRKQILQPKVMNLNSVINDLKDLLSRLMDERFEIKTELDENLKNVVIDAGQFEQILINLLVNARDAMPNGGRICITTSNEILDKSMSTNYLSIDPGQYVMISVRDTGFGMDSQTQARIFEPFFTTKEIGKGTGLGLATVFGIVKQNKGTIWVYSEVNKGTVFKIYLPIVDEKVTTESPSLNNKPKLSVSNENKKILIVEDEAELRDAVATVLKNVGYQVFEAANGAIAYEMIANNSLSPDLIISDVMMPEMTGPALARKLSKIRPNDKILFLSGYADDLISINNEKTTQYDFLEKPFQLQILLDKISGMTTD